jgi:hypothetical protein
VLVVPSPVVSLTGLAATYKHTALGVKLSGNPPGGVFSGMGVNNEYFYPRIAGIGNHIITYTYDNSVCVSQDAKNTTVLLDEGSLKDGFSIQLFNNPGHPYLWVVSKEYSAIEIRLLSSTGQFLQTVSKNVYPGGNFINIDATKFPHGVYLVTVYHSASGKTQAVKLLN